MFFTKILTLLNSYISFDKSLSFFMKYYYDFILNLKLNHTINYPNIVNLLVAYNFLKLAKPIFKPA